MDFFFTNTAFRFTGCWLMDWNCVDYCDVFTSCLDSYSDGTHSLQRIHWWASDVMLHFSKSDEEKLIYILNGLRVSQLSAHWLNWGYSFSEKDPYRECCFPDWITAIINRFKVHFLTQASNTHPKVPWPIFASFSYLENSSQKGNSTPS